MALTKIVTDGIATGAVTATQIAANAVTVDDISDGSISTAKIADANVTTAKIADANVTTAKIADANVTEAKLATDSVTTEKVADSNVTTAKIADANVTTAKLADGAVTTAKLPDGAVTTEKIGTVPVSKFTNDSNYATVSQIPTNTNQLTNGAGFITSAPTPGNGTITVNQGGVSKGTFTVNQTGNTTINLDKGILSGSGVGGIIQVRHRTFTAPVAYSGIFTDMGDTIRLSITPTSSSSKILVMLSVTMGTNETSVGYYLRRNYSVISAATGDANGNRPRVTTKAGATRAWTANLAMNFLDSPGTTNTVTYDLAGGSYDSGRPFFLNRAELYGNGYNMDDSTAMSSITLLEIA